MSPTSDWYPDGSDETSTTRYDLVLVAIPLAFAVAAVASVALPLSLLETLTAASLVGVAGIVDAVFRNPPAPTAGEDGATGPPAGARGRASG